MPAGVCTPNACTACSQRQKSQAAQQVTWIHSGGGGPSGQVFGPRPVCSYGVARVLVPGLLSGARQLWFFVSSSTGEFPPPQKALSHGICAPPPLHNSRVIAPFRVDLLWRVHRDLIRAQARWAGTFLTPAHPTNELNFGNLNERDASREFFFHLKRSNVYLREVTLSVLSCIRLHDRPHSSDCGRSTFEIVAE